MRRTAKLIGGALLATAFWLPTVADAQEDIRNVSVRDRARPDYDPLGVRAGAFLVYPSLTLGSTYDDNIYATDDDEDDDFIFGVTPSISAESQWSRHQLRASVFGDFGFYLSEDDSNYVDFGGDVTSRIDVTRDDRATIRVGTQRLHEDRDEQDTAEVDDVTQYWRYTADANYRHTFNRLFVQPNIGFERRSYEEAGDDSNADRDRDRYRAGLRTGWALSPRLNIFGQVAGDSVRYDDTGVNRDNEGIDARVGTEIDFTGIVFGEFSIGYTHRMYDDRENASGPAGSAGITWNITPLTSIEFFGDAGIDETNVVFDGDEASGNIYTALGVDVTHELRRNVLLNGLVTYDRDDFEGTSRTDNTFGLGAGVTWLVNRRFSLDATYRFETRDSDDDDAEFDRNVFRIGVTARL